MHLRKKFLFAFPVWCCVILHFILAFVTMKVYAAAQGVSFYYFVPVMLLYLLIPFFLSKEKSVPAFWVLESLYFAFIPTIDMAMLCRLFDGRDIFEVGFNVNESLVLLSRFPRELVPVLIFVAFLGQKWGKRDIVKVVVVGGIVALLGVGMLLLPELCEVLLYWLVYVLVLLVYDLFMMLCKEEKGKYERIILGILVFLFWMKGCYQMLLILGAYLPA